MSDPDPAASVGEEAARLAQAFASWSRRTAEQSAHRADETASGRSGDAARTDRTADAASDHAVADAHHAATGEASGRTTGEEPTSAAAGLAPTCGCADEGMESVCQVCPVCRTAGLLQLIAPEVLDRVAEVLTTVAGGLRASADQRRPTDPEQ